MLITYKGEKYVAVNTAQTMNGGESYVCMKLGDWSELYLIPTDSEFVTEG